jgi:hypothetical protein
LLIATTIGAPDGLGAAGAHGGERLVARRVDEGDQPVVLDRLVGADGLGDAAGLARDDVGVADLVEQLRLAVVDVAHDRDDRRTGDGVFVVVLPEVLDAEHLLELHLLLLARVDEADLRADLCGEEVDHVVGQGLRGRHHLALLEQEADDVGRGAVQLGTEVLGAGPALDHDLALGDGSV